MDPQGAPFEFLDKQGEYQGISVGYIDFLKDKLKIEMTPSDALCWNEVLESARQGRIDVITSVAKTPALEKFLLFTKPYIEFPIVIFSPKEAPLVNGLADVSPTAGSAWSKGTRRTITWSPIIRSLTWPSFPTSTRPSRP